MKILPHSNATSNNKKRQSTEWEEIFASHVSDKMLPSKIYKVFKRLNNKKIELKNGQRAWREYIQTAHSYMKNALH